MTVDRLPILITGAGLVTPLGLTREATWQAVRAGRCGLGPLSAIEQPLPEASTGGQAPDLSEAGDPRASREVRYLRHAITEALADAGGGEPLPYSPSRCGFMLGTTLHGMRAGGRFFRSGDNAALADFLAGTTLRDATAGLPFTGFAATACSACSSSLGSIVLALSLLRSGRLDCVIAGGYDAISEYVYGGFNSLRLVAPGPLRPFTRGRQGMKLAEGYGVVVLERAENAARRGARGLAEVLGHGESADAHHLTQPHPQGEGAARAMRAALDDAGVEPSRIDLIAAHATGTPDNDAGEFAALSRVFGADLPRMPVVAFKSHLGHTLGGAGAVELILSALCLRDQIVPACPNVRPEDLEFPGLRVSTGTAQPARIRATLNTSLGFGGANTCVVLGPPSNGNAHVAQPLPAVSSVPPVAESQPGAAVPHEVSAEGGCATSSARAPLTFHVSRFSAVSRFILPVHITGVGVVLPGVVGNEAFAAALISPETKRITQDTGPIPESDIISLLNARRVRRMSEYVKLSLAATMLACRDAGIEDIPAFAATCPALLGSTHGSTNYSEAYYGQIVKEGIAAANPMLFAEGVPNAAAAHLSLMLSLRGPCQTVIGTRTAGLDALALAATRIANGEWDRAIVGAGEEFSPVVHTAYRHWGLHRTEGPAAPFAKEGTGFVAGCGAVTLVLESTRSMEARGVRPRGRVLAATGPVPRGGAADVLRSLGDVSHVITSANGTWLDRLEAVALRHGGQRVVTSLAGHVAETFSVMPLAAIAAGLLTGRMPKLLGDLRAKAGMRPATGDEQPDEFAVLCSDYTRVLSAALVAFTGERKIVAAAAPG
ncbi:MAG TPA: beta-ketoacyl-[acyl-carrier-protein] synthase family protein [Tepidisphaeraceae bacterium]|jgi:3-oxoacyl-[acyl-carrier-protein] synthase II|nr:beta-ketoacyl-[acyl-carrier-protein] synthase family protein [Tepidisphaeraceae bacterium]